MPFYNFRSFIFLLLIDRFMGNEFRCSNTTFFVYTGTSKTDSAFAYTQINNVCASMKCNLAIIDINKWQDVTDKRYKDCITRVLTNLSIPMFWVNVTTYTDNNCYLLEISNGTSDVHTKTTHCDEKHYFICEKNYTAAPKIIAAQIGPTPVHNSVPGYLPINALSNLTPPMTTHNVTSLSTNSSFVPNTTHEVSTSTTDATITTQSMVDPAARPVTTTFTSGRATAQSWIDLDQRRVYVVYNKTTYDEAKDHCKAAYHASLIMFGSLTSYLDLCQSLNLTEGNYWVAEKQNTMKELRNDPTSDCLLLHVSDESSYLTTKRCFQNHYSICSKSHNTYEVLRQPAFVEMIKNMTVDRKQTSHARRQLLSAEDKRMVAKAMGTVGVCVLFFVVGIVIVLDLPRLKHLFPDNKKKKLNKIELKPVKK